MGRDHFGVVAMLALASLAPLDARSVPITFQFEGSVRAVVDSGFLDGSVVVGTPFYGFYTFDSAAPDESPDPDLGLYEVTSAMLFVGTYTFYSVPGGFPGVVTAGVYVRRDPGGYGFGGGELAEPGVFGFQLIGGPPFPSDALPLAPPNPADFAAADAQMVFGREGVAHLDGVVTRIVPEPATGLLLLPAVLFLLLPPRGRLLRRKRAGDIRAGTICSVCLATLLAAPEARAQGVDRRVNDPAQDIGANGLNGAVGVAKQSETAIAVNGSTICVGWRDQKYHSYPTGFRLNGYAVSTDGGLSFQDRGFVSTTEGVFADPALVYSPVSGFVFSSVESGFAGLLIHRDAACQALAFDGRITSTPGADKQILAVDPRPAGPGAGGIYAAWSQSGSIRIAYTDNPGVEPDAAWTLQWPLNAGGIGAWPAVAPNGDAFVAFTETVGQPPSLGLRIFWKTFGGSTWSERAPIASELRIPQEASPTLACDQRPALNGPIRSGIFPQIAIQTDPEAAAGYVVHAVYNHDPTLTDADDSNVYYRRSTNAADPGSPTPWEPLVRLNSPIEDLTDTDQWNPALAASEDFVAVSWYDRRLDPANNWRYARFLAVSDDHGVTWSPNIRVSDLNSEGLASPVARATGFPATSAAINCFAGDYDQLAISASTVHVVWSDDRREDGPACPGSDGFPYYSQECPDPDVYYDQVVLTDTDADRVIDFLDNCKIIPNPRVPAGEIDLSWMTLTGGQRDDDGDGYGNECDPDFTNGWECGSVAGFLYTYWGHYAWMNREVYESLGGEITALTCGRAGVLRCSIFDKNADGVLDLNDYCTNNCSTAVWAVGNPDVPVHSAWQGGNFPNPLMTRSGRSSYVNQTRCEVPDPRIEVRCEGPCCPPNPAANCSLAAPLPGCIQCPDPAACPPPTCS